MKCKQNLTTVCNLSRFLTAGYFYSWLSSEIKGSVVPLLNDALRHDGVRGGGQSFTEHGGGSDWPHVAAALPSTKHLGTHWIWALTGPRASLDGLKKGRTYTMPENELWPHSTPDRCYVTTPTEPSLFTPNQQVSHIRMPVEVRRVRDLLPLCRRESATEPTVTRTSRYSHPPRPRFGLTLGLPADWTYRTAAVCTEIELDYGQASARFSSL